MSDEKKWDGEVPFEIGIATQTWTFPNGDYVTVEQNTSGYFIHGRLGGKDWHDEDHEDFYCADSDEFLDFLETYELTSLLSRKADTNDH